MHASNFTEASAGKLQSRLEWPNNEPQSNNFDIECVCMPFICATVWTLVVRRWESYC